MTSPHFNLPASAWLATLREFHFLEVLDLHDVFDLEDSASQCPFRMRCSPTCVCCVSAIPSAPAGFLENIFIPPASVVIYDGCALNPAAENYGKIVDTLDTVTSVRRHGGPDAQPFRTCRVRKALHISIEDADPEGHKGCIIELWETRFSADELDCSPELPEEPSLSLITHAGGMSFLAWDVFLDKFYMSQLNVLHVLNINYDVYTLSELRELSIEHGDLSPTAPTNSPIPGRPCRIWRLLSRDLSPVISIARG